MRDGGDILINRDLFLSPQSAALTAPLGHKGSLYGGRGFRAGAEVSLRLGHARVLTVPRTVIHCARAASLPAPTDGETVGHCGRGDCV